MDILIKFKGPCDYKVCPDLGYLVLTRKENIDIWNKIENLNKRFCLQFQYSKCQFCENLGCLITNIDKPIYLCPTHIYELFNENWRNPKELKINKKDIQPTINENALNKQLLNQPTIKHQRIIDKISKIGKSLGYSVFTEYSVGFGKNFGRIDVVFKKNKFTFGFEVENYKNLSYNTSRKRIISKDMKKLKMLGGGVIISTRIEDRIDELFIRRLLIEKKLRILE
ncbi:MAG: hypothetical protein KJ697_03860 [Nanoarchaeota archaeon]|nr:hypothetical protein [Nanoarchaeota archaeon]